MHSCKGLTFCGVFLIVPPFFDQLYSIITMKGGKKKDVKPHIIEQEHVPKSILPHQKGFALVISAKPNSKQSKIVEINEEYIGIAVAAPAKEGEANQELVAYLVYVLGVKKNTVYLDKGSKSRNKLAIIETQELKINDIYTRLKADME